MDYVSFPRRTDNRVSFKDLLGVRAGKSGYLDFETCSRGDPGLAGLQLPEQMGMGMEEVESNQLKHNKGCEC